MYGFELSNFPSLHIKISILFMYLLAFGKYSLLNQTVSSFSISFIEPSVSA